MIANSAKQRSALAGKINEPSELAVNFRALSRPLADGRSCKLRPTAVRPGRPAAMGRLLHPTTLRGGHSMWLIE